MFDALKIHRFILSLSLIAATPFILMFKRTLGLVLRSRVKEKMKKGAFCSVATRW